MYYSKLLDTETFAQVVTAAPELAEPPVTEARMVLQALRMLSMEGNANLGMDGKPYWICALADLPGLPEAIIGKRRWRLCREMGLVMHRRGPGYYVAWNGEQLDLLWRYFRLDEVKA